MVLLSTKIKIFRLIRFGGSRQAFADAAGVSPGTIGALERDDRKSNHRSTIRKIEAAIGRGLFDPDVEAAFSILSDDAAKKEAVIKALDFLERRERNSG